MLEEHDFDVHAFDKPQDVMENFRPGVYNLVVLDIKMPIINGLQIYQEIRKVDKNVKVCFITASEEYHTGLIVQLEREKCFMQKPISRDDFIDRIKLALA
jgi:FixJ family two-component response regulator